MCGRYNFSAEEVAELKEIARQIDAKYADANWHTGEIYPTNYAPVFVCDSDHVEPELFGWGFPSFQGKRNIINARAETADAKPMFRRSLEERRCIVPTSGFYEWDREKRKHLFRLPNETVLYLAGLWNEFAGEPRFCILTTTPNESVEDIHNRMPVILSKSHLSEWLTDGAAAKMILRATPPLLTRQDVSAQMRLI